GADRHALVVPDPDLRPPLPGLENAPFVADLLPAVLPAAVLVCAALPADVPQRRPPLLLDVRAGVEVAHEQREVKFVAANPPAVMDLGHQAIALGPGPELGRRFRRRFLLQVPAGCLTQFSERVELLLKVAGIDPRELLAANIGVDFPAVDLAPAAF